jgi:hypothetical protein
MAVFAAATAATAQAGLGYGLGILSWAPTADIGDQARTSPGAWSAALVWTAPIATSSVIIGAVAGDRAGGPSSRGAVIRGLRRLTLALAAAVGGTVVVALVLIPTTQALVTGTNNPQLRAVEYAGGGLVLGIVVAVMATTSRAIAANVFATTTWLWLVAVVAVIHRALVGRPPSYVSPGVWKFTANGPVWHVVYLPGVLLMLGSGLLSGGLAAFPAAGRGAARLGVVISGGVGPMLLAVPCLFAAPDPTAPFEQLSAYDTAPYMVLAGLIGSILVAAVGGVPEPRHRAASASERSEAEASPTTRRSEVGARKVTEIAPAQPLTAFASPLVADPDLAWPAQLRSMSEPPTSSALALPPPPLD